MLSKHGNGGRNQLEIISLEDLVPTDHLVRKIEDSINFDFIYELVEEHYCLDNGRPSVDPVVLIKMVLIQYLFGIRSMRQTIKEIETNVAYRWFLGYGLTEQIPHFSTFGKNYIRRFQDTNLFEVIFYRILQEAMDHGFVSPNIVFIDSTHVKANANKKKYIKKVVEAQTKDYQEQLNQEINEERVLKGKKPLVPKTIEMKEVKENQTDSESGLFIKNEKESMFVYSFHTACDQNGFVLGAIVEPSNVHDNQVFLRLYKKIKTTITRPTAIAVDAGYKTPFISKVLFDDGVRPVMPYTRPQTKDGFFRKYEYVFDEFFNWYICPAGETLTYRTTTRDGYRQYSSNPVICKECPLLSQCTASQNHTKQIQRHIWQEYIEESRTFKAYKSKQTDLQTKERNH